LVVGGALAAPRCYIFARDKADASSLADVAGHLLGSVNSGIRKKLLEGYGKD
jgi:hypothetical protein